MFRILKLVLLAASAANCAPAATFIPFAATPFASPLAQPYFFVGPQPQAQFQYQPLLKFQQSVAPASAASNIDTSKGQYVFLYPSGPQLPSLLLRQDGGDTDYWAQINNWWNDISQSLNPAPVSVAPAPITTQPQPASETAKMEKIMLETNTDAMQSTLPAATMDLNMNRQRFYLINSLPQFYGNFAALPAATIRNPILAIEPLKARSAVDSIPAENEQIEQIRSQDMAEIVEQPLSPAVAQPIQQLQLKSNIVEPLQRLEVDQPQIPLVNNEPVPEVAAQQLARFLDEARSQDAGPNAGNALNENNQLRAEEKPLEDEEISIAQAKPSGIAVSGKGGVSSSAPMATAVVGEGGLALASPSAISLSGNFEDEEKKIKTD